MKKLNELTDELELSIDRFAKNHFLMTPHVCPECKYLYTDEANLESMYETGECLACDHVEGEVIEEKLNEYATN